VGGGNLLFIPGHLLASQMPIKDERILLASGIRRDNLSSITEVIDEVEPDEKKALGFSKEGRAYVYRPLVRREECVDAASQSFLERVFGGSLKPMLAHFVERDKLSPDEIRELRRLLKERE